MRRRRAGAPAVQREARALLLLACRLDAARRRAAVAALAGPIDWPALVERARAHGVLELVHRGLADLDFPGTPPAVREALAAARRVSGARNALLARELARVLARLGAAGIPALPFKGPALAAALYGDLSLRSCSDVDVLVPLGAARAAVSVLGAAGYRPPGGRVPPAFVFRHHAEVTLRRHGDGIDHVLDLHWGVGWHGRAEQRAMDRLWAAARPDRFGGAATFALPPEWHLLVLAVHAARHRWTGLKWLVDVHELCASAPIDWRLASELADGAGWRRALAITLGTCRALFDTPVPAAMAPAPPAWVTPEALPAVRPAGWDDALLPLRVLERRRDRLRHLARLLLVPTAAECTVRLPAALGFLYYPWRPARLAVRWTSRLVAAGRHAHS